MKLIRKDTAMDNRPDGEGERNGTRMRAFRRKATPGLPTRVSGRQRTT